MKKKTKIAGVPCSIETDDLGLYNVFITGEKIPEGLPAKEIRRRIYEGEILMCEWIVRGEGPLDHAIEVAEKVIAVRRTGRQVTHRLDPDGRIMAYEVPPFEVMEQLRIDHENWRKDADEE